MSAPLILASTSAARRAMLTAAGIPYEAHAPHVDEEALKQGLRAQKTKPRDQADALAEAKAVRLSQKYPGALVLGADQILALPNGAILDKPIDLDAARAQLQMLRGQKHQLISAAVVAENGVAVWRHIAVAQLEMRQFSDDFLERYIAAEKDHLLHTVGGYRLEALGAQLFRAIEGEYFTILGLPLLAVLDYLRVRGIIAP